MFSPCVRKLQHLTPLPAVENINIRERERYVENEYTEASAGLFSSFGRNSSQLLSDNDTTDYYDLRSPSSGYQNSLNLNNNIRGTLPRTYLRDLDGTNEQSDEDAHMNLSFNNILQLHNNNNNN